MTKPPPKMALDSQQHKHDFEEYNDDFEEYDDDFEEYNDAGQIGQEHYDTENDGFEDYHEDKDQPKTQILGNIKREGADVKSTDIGGVQNNSIAGVEPNYQQSSILSRIKQPVSTLVSVPTYVSSSAYTLPKPQKTHAIHKNMLRWKVSRALMQQLSRILTMDIVFFPLFELSPMDDYTLYIRNYRELGVDQTASQAVPETLDSAEQTDGWGVVNKWTEAPPNGYNDCGSDGVGSDPSELNLANGRAAALHISNSKSFLNFIRSSARVVETILYEECGSNVHPESKLYKPEENVFASASAEFQIPKFVSGHSARVILDDPIFSLVLWTCQSQFDVELAVFKSLIGVYRVGDLVPSRFCNEL